MRLYITLSDDDVRKSREGLVPVEVPIRGKTKQYRGIRYKRMNAAGRILTNELKKQGVKDAENATFKDKNTGEKRNKDELLQDFKKRGNGRTIQQFVKQEYKIASDNPDAKDKTKYKVKTKNEAAENGNVGESKKPSGDVQVLAERGRYQKHKFWGTYKCGHEGRVETGGYTEEFAEGRANEIFAGECTSCERKRKDEEAQRRESEDGLPEITQGSEKQIAWARSLRAEMLNKLEAGDYMEFPKKQIAGLKAQQKKGIWSPREQLRTRNRIKAYTAMLNIYKSVEAMAKTSTNAKELIDKRGFLLTDYQSDYEEMMALLKNRATDGFGVEDLFGEKTWAFLSGFVKDKIGIDDIFSESNDSDDAKQPEAVLRWRNRRGNVRSGGLPTKGKFIKATNDYTVVKSREEFINASGKLKDYNRDNYARATMDMLGIKADLCIGDCLGGTAYGVTYRTQEKTMLVELLKNDKRALHMQKKTADHENMHAIMPKTDMGTSIEEPIVEAAAIYMASERGHSMSNAQIYPSYAEYMVHLLPILKGTRGFKKCETVADFGKILLKNIIEGNKAGFDGVKTYLDGIPKNTNLKQYEKYIGKTPEERAEKLDKYGNRLEKIVKNTKIQAPEVSIATLISALKSGSLTLSQALRSQNTRGIAYVLLLCIMDEEGIEVVEK